MNHTSSADKSPAPPINTRSGLSMETRYVLAHWYWVLCAGLASGIIGLGLAFLIPPTYTARATFIAPQSSQSSAASALAALGNLGSLASASGVKSSADQYASLMQSAKIGNRIISQFKLSDVYGTELSSDTLKQLQQSTRISVGKKDGLITVEVDDRTPTLAAAIANTYISELKKLTDSLALTEATSRRLFFEQQLETANKQLTAAQSRLEASGVSIGLLKAEPKAATEALARLSAELAGAEVQLEAMRRTMADGTPEVQRKRALTIEIRNQIKKLEINQPAVSNNTANYIDAYRAFKYQETLFEILSKQFEIAKLDEAKDSAFIQVIDSATPPERKSKPKRASIALAFFVVGALIAALLLWRKQFVFNQK